MSVVNRHDSFHVPQYSDSHPAVHFRGHFVLCLRNARQCHVTAVLQGLANERNLIMLCCLTTLLFCALFGASLGRPCPDQIHGNLHCDFLLGESHNEGDQLVLISNILSSLLIINFCNIVCLCEI